ncbi:hypothetical protein L2E82_21108 [Cichorium intybus]|uniref:Uncharacterized protein n=1 Tax=Cichorium intybus TaxID=13427 RepID=A0ACB9DVI2_CICIN|nr:hypothetical protein L2E82_21108 [Cichorium intybus]
MDEIIMDKYYSGPLALVPKKSNPRGRRIGDDEALKVEDEEEACVYKGDGEDLDGEFTLVSQNVTSLQ